MSKQSDVFSQQHIGNACNRHKRVVGAPGRPWGGSLLEPATDVYETDDAVIVVMEIAGIAEEEIESKSKAAV